MGISVSGSIKGYSLKTWLKRNKESLKVVIMATAGIIAFFSMQYLPIPIQASISALIAMAVKMGIDAVDFWLSDVEI
jgi:hypothetical protein